MATRRILPKTGYIAWLRRISAGDPRGWQFVCHSERESECWAAVEKRRQQPPWTDAICCSWTVLPAHIRPQTMTRV